jgi:hypothetical protein
MMGAPHQAATHVQDSNLSGGARARRRGGRRRSRRATTAQVAAAPTRCDTGDLRASLLRSSPAAGQRYAHVQLTNISPRTCTIFGYAGAQLLRADGSRVPPAIVRDHSRTPHLVTLRHGQRAPRPGTGA